jgi:acyl dehydratase
MSSIKIGERRYRESLGRYLEDFEVGDVYEHRPGRTITEADSTWFTLLTMNQHPIRFDQEYSKHSEFGRPIVNSTLTMSIITGMSVSDISQKAIANPGWTDITMPAPVFPVTRSMSKRKVEAKS